jgi:outer membrane protein OmpA-like peptidoglycan-associated protein
MRIFCFCIVFLAITPSLFSQAYTTRNNASDRARRAFENGKDEINAGNNTLAMEFFEQAVKADPKFIDAWLMLAGTQVEAQRWADAERNFEKVLELSPTFEPNVYYGLAEVEWEQDKFEEAAQHAEAFLATNPGHARLKLQARRLAANARFAREAMKKPVAFDPKPIGEGVNSPDDEYMPTITADGSTMIVTRRDRGGNEDFYVSTWQNGQWQPAEPVKEVNTWQNEGGEAISPDGTWLVFTACDRQDDGSQGSCDLYWSQLKATGWTKPQPFSATINSPAWDGQPTISADGKTLMFSSERPGGRGSKDLWYATRQADGKWTKPQNLGEHINSDGLEQTPFLHPDGQTLYFTSDGHPGMGKNDLYFARRQPDGSWGKPQNLGYPINTKKQEGTLTVSLDGRTAYFAADYPKTTKGLHDIYMFELPEYARPQPVTYARVRVTDAATGKVMAAKVDFIDLQAGQPFSSATTKKDGTALVCLPAGKDYALNVNRKGYLFHSENFNLTQTATFDKPFLLDVALQPIGGDSAAIAAGKARPVVLRNVFFETASAALRRESQSELNRLTELLVENPKVRIQLNGHTDNTGDEATNQKLSETRAKAVYDYLVSKGIAAARLKFKGFGETQPVTTNDTAEGRQQNRRTEFVLW